jgi:hypothetical protein
MHNVVLDDAPPSQRFDVAFIERKKAGIIEGTRRTQFARTKRKNRPAQAGKMRLDPLEAFLDRYNLCEARADDLKSGFGGNAGRILEHAIHKAVSALCEF